jgi:hypothetical protein
MFERRLEFFHWPNFSMVIMGSQADYISSDPWGAPTEVGMISFGSGSRDFVDHDLPLLENRCENLLKLLFIDLV